MSYMMLLESDLAAALAIEHAATRAGHATYLVNSCADARAALRNRRFEMLLVSEAACAEPPVAFALEAEKHGVRCVIMTAGAQTLQKLRAKGLICFEAPADLVTLEVAKYM